MAFAISLADIQRAGVTPTADEAVAIVLRLIHDRDTETPEPPFGPPSLTNVRLTGAGDVECRAFEATPAVTEVAILLQSMLASTAHVPGGLRYAIARALHEVDAPPFDSIDEFSSTLSRHDPPDRETVIRRLVERVQASGGADVPAVDRRRSIRSPDDLRRQLRDADRRFYENRVVPIEPTSMPRRRRLWVAGALLAGIVGIAGAGDAIRTHEGMPAVAPPPVSTTERTAVDVHDHVEPVISMRPVQQPARPHVKGLVHEVHGVHGVHTVHEVHTVHAVRATNTRDHRVLHRLRLRWLRNIVVTDDLSSK